MYGNSKKLFPGMKDSANGSLFFYKSVFSYPFNKYFYLVKIN